MVGAVGRGWGKAGCKRPYLGSFTEFSTPRQQSSPQQTRIIVVVIVPIHVQSRMVIRVRGYLKKYIFFHMEADML
jgi:hypothetical protein